MEEAQRPAQLRIVAPQASVEQRASRGPRVVACRTAGARRGEGLRAVVTMLALLAPCLVVTCRRGEFMGELSQVGAMGEVCQGEPARNERKQIRSHR